MPSRWRATGRASSASRIPNSMCRATSSSTGPAAIVVAIRGRSPRRNASRTAGLSWRNHWTSMAHLLGALDPTTSRAYLQLSDVVQVYDYGEADGRPFLAMEYLPGGSLHDRLRRAGRL